MAEQSAAVAVVAGIFGIVGTMIPIIDGRFKSRESRQREIDDLDRDSKEIDFWSRWAEAAQKLTDTEIEPTKLLAFSRITEIARLRQQQIAERPSPSTSKILEMHGFRKVFLIFKPARSAAWIPRFFFYAIVLYLFQEFIFNWRDFESGKPLVWVLLLLLVNVAFTFRQLSVWLDLTDSLS